MWSSIWESDLHLVLACVGLCWFTGTAHAAPPLTIPALREWVPATGHYRLHPESRIVAPGELTEPAATLANEIWLQTGYGLSVVADGGATNARVPDIKSGAAPAGDIWLTLDASDADVGREFFDLAFIERHIRDFAYAKGNYLHLHLSEVDALGGYGRRRA